MTRIILVTGSSRGIGAETVAQLARQGDHVLVNYREKEKRARGIADEIIAQGGQADVLGFDITDPESVNAALAEVKEKYGKLDVLVLNASGGLEMGAPENYPMTINRDAQVNLVTAAAPLIPSGGRIVFVTSHQAHFHGKKEVPEQYIPIAESKRAGEDELRKLIPDLEKKGITLVVVSGDMIDGTIIVRLLERRDPNAVATRREQAALPTVEEFAEAIVKATSSDVPSGHTDYIGGPDYLELVDQ